MPERRPLHLRINTTPPPAVAGNGRSTAFGLQDRAEQLTPGTLLADGSRAFDLELEVSQDPASGTLRFHGPFVHGPGATRFLYLGWRYTDGPREWVRRQKLPLASLTWDQAASETGAPATFAAEVPCITERCATIPVEWRPIASSEA